MRDNPVPLLKNLIFSELTSLRRLASARRIASARMPTLMRTGPAASPAPVKPPIESVLKPPQPN